MLLFLHDWILNSLWYIFLTSYSTSLSISFIKACFWLILLVFIHLRLLLLFLHSSKVFLLSTSGLTFSFLILLLKCCALPQVHNHSNVICHFFSSGSFQDLKKKYLSSVVWLRYISSWFSLSLSSQGFSELPESVNLSFTKFGQFSAIISSNIYSAPIIVSCPRSQMALMLSLFVLFYRSLRLFWYFFLCCCSNWIICIALLKFIDSFLCHRYFIFHCKMSILLIFTASLYFLRTTVFPFVSSTFSPTLHGT